MSGQYLGLVELLLTAVGMGAFGWWQLRSLKRDREITRRREAERAAGSAAAGAAGHSKGK